MKPRLQLRRQPQDFWFVCLPIRKKKQHHHKTHNNTQTPSSILKIIRQRIAATLPSIFALASVLKLLLAGPKGLNQQLPPCWRRQPPSHPRQQTEVTHGSPKPGSASRFHVILLNRPELESATLLFFLLFLSQAVFILLF